MIALDTNLLVYAHRAALPEHRAARRAIEHAAADPRGFGFAAVCAIEFWSVVTHPLAAGRPSRPEEARQFLASLTVAGAAAWTPGDGFAPRLLSLAEELGALGPRIFDLEIALTAFDHGATEIWTHDRSFVSLPGLAVSDPLV